MNDRKANYIEITAEIKKQNKELTQDEIESMELRACGC